MRKLLSLPNLAVVLLLIIAAALMLNAAWTDSAIFDETAHIVAGYTYVKHLDYRFNPEHPPLVKMLAGLPLLFQNLNFDTSKGYWNGLNEQWWAGNEFLYKSGNNADQIIFWARIGPILLALLLILFTYYIAKELVGRWWALLPPLLLAFSPILLAHGHYVTTDIAAALGILLSIYTFNNYLENPARRTAILAGLTFGFAQAVKFSSILLMPYLFLIAILFYFIKDNVPFYRYLWRTILVMAIGYIVIVYPLYLLTTWNYPVEKQLSDTSALIQNFRFPLLANLNIWLAGNKTLRPFGEYLLGVLLVAQRSAGGNNAYFLGELSSHGWWYYFPLSYLMKEPLPTLLLIFLAAFLSLIKILRGFAQGLKKSREDTAVWLQKNNISPRQRAETLGVDDWVRLTVNC